MRTSDYGIMLSAMSTVAFIGGQKANKYCTKAMEHFQSSPHNNFEHIYECMANGFMKLGNINDCLRYYKMTMETASDAFPHLRQRLASYKRRIASAYLHQQNLNETRKY